MEEVGREVVDEGRGMTKRGFSSNRLLATDAPAWVFAYGASHEKCVWAMTEGTDACASLLSECSNHIYAIATAEVSGCTRKMTLDMHTRHHHNMRKR